MFTMRLRRILTLTTLGALLMGALVSSFIVLPHAARAAKIHPLTAPTPTTTGNGLGTPGFSTFWSQQLNGIKDLRVNVANGNLVLSSKDEFVQGTGLNLEIDSYYNSLAGATSYLGQNWVFGTGGDLHLVVNGDGSVTYYNKDGYAAVYTVKTGGGYNDAPGLNATLTQNVGGTFTLKFHRSGEALAFTSGGQLTTDTDKNGNAISFTYTSGKLTTITDTQGRTTTISYNTAGNISQISDPHGNLTKYGYDATNTLLTGLTDQNGKTDTFSYTGSDLTFIDTLRSHKTYITYDTSHRVATIKNPLNGTTTFTYNSGNTVVTDPNSHSTTYDYDSQGRVTQTIDALSNSQSTTWTSNSDVQQATDALTNTATFTYDTTTNNLTTAQDATGATTSYGYTDSAHPYYPNSQTDAQGNQLAYSYDSPGNVLNTTDNLTSQNTVAQTYYSNGTVHTATDARGKVTTYGYDTHGNLTSVTPPARWARSPLPPTPLAVSPIIMMARGSTPSCNIAT